MTEYLRQKSKVQKKKKLQKKTKHFFCNSKCQVSSEKILEYNCH